MKLPAASLGFKLNLALLLFVLVLGVASAAIVLYGFSRTQDSATERSQEALEEEGKLALQAVAGGISESGALQFESAAAVGQRAGRYMEEFRASGATPEYDTSRLVQTEDGVWYDPDPGRRSDVVVVNHRDLEGDVLDDIAYTAALDPLYPALAEGFPGQLSGEAYNPIAIIYVGVSSVGRYYPPIGIIENTPAEVNVGSFYDRFGPVANPERETVWTVPYEDLQGHGLVITAQTPVYQGDTFRGIFEVDLSIARLVELLNGIKPTPGGFTFYVDTDGQILETDSFAFLTAEAEENASLVAVLDAMKAPADEPSVAVETIAMGGRDYFVAHTGMAMPGGSIGVAAPVDEVTAQAALITASIEDEGDRTFTIIIAAMGALFVAGLAGAGILNRRLLLVPLQRLSAATRAVAGGDLDTKVELDSRDELGTLAGSFNSMVEKLRESERGLERQVEERTAELSTLLRVTSSLSSTLDLDALLNLIIDELKTIVPYSGAGIDLIVNGEVKQLAVRRPPGYSTDPSADQPTIRTSQMPPALQPLLRNESIHIEDVRGDSEAAQAFRAEWEGTLNATTAEWVRSLLLVPIFGRDSLIGSISVVHSEPHFFTGEQIRIVQSVASQAALSIENARLYEETQRRTRELAALLEVSRAVASTLDTGEVLRAILDQLGAITEHTGASVLLVGDDAFEFVEARSVTGSPATAGARIRYDSAPELSAAMRQGTVIIDDITADEPLAAGYRTAIQSIGLLDQPPFNVIRSWMSVPLALKDRVLGVLTLSWTEPAYFTQDHARLARAFTDQAVVAMENARLFQQAGQVAAMEERQRLARDLHDSVSQALYGIALGARTARTQLDRDPGKAAEPLEYVISLASAGMAEMRSLIFELRPESLQEEGLVAALSKQTAALEARYGIQVKTDLCDEPDIPLESKEAVYRIAQEALHNVVKHSRATEVAVSLAGGDGSLSLTVADNGVGFDAADGFPGHLGLRSMAERAQRRGGDLQVSSEPGSGTRVTATFPLSGIAPAQP